MTEPMRDEVEGLIEWHERGAGQAKADANIMTLHGIPAANIATAENRAAFHTRAAALLRQLAKDRERLLAFAHWCQSSDFNSRDLAIRAAAAIAKAEGHHAE